MYFFLFQGPVAASDVAKSLIPNDGLPYVSGVGPVENEELIQRFQNKDSVPFTLNRNLRVYVKLVNCKFVCFYCEHIIVQCTYYILSFLFNSLSKRVKWIYLLSSQRLKFEAQKLLILLSICGVSDILSLCELYAEPQIYID